MPGKNFQNTVLACILRKNFRTAFRHKNTPGSFTGGVDSVVHLMQVMVKRCMVMLQWDLLQFNDS
jgi:hypothetical protein